MKDKTDINTERFFTNILYIGTRGVVDAALLYAWTYIAYKYNVWWCLIFPTLAILINTYFIGEYLKNSNVSNTKNMNAKKHKLEE